jgi:hypothetical protein
MNIIRFNLFRLTSFFNFESGFVLLRTLFIVLNEISVKIRLVGLISQKLLHHVKVSLDFLIKWIVFRV